MSKKSFNIIEHKQVEVSQEKCMPLIIEATVRKYGEAYRVAVPREWLNKKVNIRLIE